MTLDDRELLRIVARIGYGARGIVYLLVGTLAVVAATGGGEPRGTRGALAAVADKPLGDVLLCIIAAGLLCFAVWQAVAAVADADGRGSGAKGLVLRAGVLVSAGIYVALALAALGIVLGWGAQQANDEQSTRDWTGWLLAQAFGPWLVGIVGACVIGAGIGLVVQAWRSGMERWLELPARQRHLAEPLSRYGFTARGAAFVLVGIFLVVAAVEANPAEAHGLGGALAALRGEPYGSALLGLVAVGLMASGLFDFVQALYRRIAAPSLGEAAARGRASLPRL